MQFVRFDLEDTDKVLVMAQGKRFVNMEKNLDRPEFTASLFFDLFKEDSKYVEAAQQALAFYGAYNEDYAI